MNDTQAPIDTLSPAPDAVVAQAVAAAPDAATGFWPQALDLLHDGGPVLVILLGLSVAAATIILLKLYQFSRLGTGAGGLLEEAQEQWRTGRPERALQVLHRSASPVARVLEAAIQGLARPYLPETKVREEVLRVAAAQLKDLGAYLRGLDAIVTLAPLLGLLGTVLGMIEAFREVEAAGGRADPAMLAGGIWEALLTTAAGLGVAIPAAAALHWLESKVEGVRHAMEDAVTRVFTATVAPPDAAPGDVARLYQRPARAD